MSHKSIPKSKKKFVFFLQKINAQVVPDALMENLSHSVPLFDNKKVKTKDRLLMYS